MNALRRGLALLLCLLLFLSLTVTASAANDPVPYALHLLVNGEDKIVRALDESYEGNPYLSLIDLAAALKGTEKQFSIRFQSTNTGGDHFLIETGKAASAAAKNADLSEVSTPLYLNLTRHRLYLNDQERKYYTYRSSGNELYMSIADVQLMLDLCIKSSADGKFHVFPDQGFAPDPKAMDESGYFDAFNSALLGDADTGAVLFSHQPYKAFPVASLSKLMAYLVIDEALQAGQVHREDPVTISDKANRLSRSIDGLVFLPSGAQIPFQELLQGMMLASSNECALALAEHVAGSEEAFVEKMNARARELGLNTSTYYTLHGLPSYAGGALPVKRQNSMSAQAVFRLCSYLLANAPSLTEMTALPYVKLEHLDYATANSNPLVFNLPGVNGLKTGSTNRAGYCLAASLPVTVGEETHTIVVVLLGAESAEIRGQAAEILLRYAQQYYAVHGFNS